MTKKLYTISVVVLNNLEITRKCLHHLEANSGSDYELIISDNGSDDGTAEFLSEFSSMRSHCKIISYGYNTGFGCPHNSALSQADGEYFVVLNNDIYIYESGWLEKLAGCFSNNPNLAIVGFAGNHSAFTANGDGIKDPLRQEYVEASCLMIPTQLAFTYGFFAEEYELAYWEDADLSLRYRQMGFDIQLVDCKYEHVQNATAATINKFLLEKVRHRNQNIFRNKWSGYLEKRFFTGRILVNAVCVRLDYLFAVTTVLQQIKASHPLIKLDLITNMPEIFLGHPAISGFLQLEREVDFKEYDRVITFDFSKILANQPVVLSLAEQAGVTVHRITPQLFLNSEEMASVSSFLPRNRLVLISNVNSLEELAIIRTAVCQAGDEPLFLEVLDGGSTYLLENEHRLAFREMAAVVARCHLFVGAPGIILQVAQACMVRSLAILAPGKDPFALGIDFVMTTCLSETYKIEDFLQQNNITWNLVYLQSLVLKQKASNNDLWQSYLVARIHGVHQDETIKQQRERLGETENNPIGRDDAFNRTITEYEQNINSLTRSLSWRITGPLRRILDVLKSL